MPKTPFEALPLKGKFENWNLQTKLKTFDGKSYLNLFSKLPNEDLAKSKSINPTMLSNLQSTEGCSL